MKLYKFLLCACLALPVMSCDDYLDIQPKGIVIPEKSEDYERLLNYAQLLKASESYPNFMTDDVFMPYEDDMTGGFVSLELPKQHLYAFNSEIFGEGESDGLWEYSYNRIYYYNVVIDDIMGATQDTEEHKKQLRAEALVGRAFEYLTLVNAYANHYDPSTAATDPGVPLMLDKNINKTNLQRATVQEVYDQIKADLDEAAPNLPEKPVLNAYRASKPVGYGMLARMYLYMGDYKKALENAVISLQNNSTLMSLFPYKVVDRDKYIGRIDVPDGDENPENIYIRLAPWTFGFSATAYASEELASLYDQEKDQRYLLYFTKYLGGIDLDYPLWAPYIYANMAMSTPEMYLIAAECEARI
ncbi:RagB/SusD family nutrient uptake outer membrane protein, partial [Phocaeicola vulgatus]